MPETMIEVVLTPALDRYVENAVNGPLRLLHEEMATADPAHMDTWRIKLNNETDAIRRVAQAELNALSKDEIIALIQKRGKPSWSLKGTKRELVESIYMRLGLYYPALDYAVTRAERLGTAASLAETYRRQADEWLMEWGYRADAVDAVPTPHGVRPETSECLKFYGAAYRRLREVEEAERDAALRQVGTSALGHLLAGPNSDMRSVLKIRGVDLAEVLLMEAARKEVVRATLGALDYAEAARTGGKQSIPVATSLTGYEQAR